MSLLLDLITTSLHTPLIFFFNDTATTEIYTLSLHDALPISAIRHQRGLRAPAPGRGRLPALGSGPRPGADHHGLDRKSTRLNSSHGYISYAVFCLKKKKHRMTRYNHTVLCHVAISIGLNRTE